VTPWECKVRQPQLPVGYTDTFSSDKYPLSPPTRRAAAVRDYLLSRGVSVQRIYIGERRASDSLVNNTTESGRARNGRIEIELIPAKQVRQPDFVWLHPSIPDPFACGLGHIRTAIDMECLACDVA
jgi:hypothetical protein